MSLFQYRSLVTQHTVHNRPLENDIKKIVKLSFYGLSYSHFLTKVAVVQWNNLRFGGCGIPVHMGLNPGHGLRGDWPSTQGNGFQMGGLSDRRSPLGGLL